jgi:acyl-CoA synthetase (AMP-forming)/AMP-acid ligase II
VAAVRGNQSTAQVEALDLVLYSRLHTWALTHPDAPCVIEAETGLTLSYSAFFAATLALRQRLGDQPRRLALHATGGAFSAVTWIAALTGGHTLLPLPTAAPMPEISALLKRMPPDTLLLENADLNQSALAAALVAAQVDTPEQITPRDLAPWLSATDAPHASASLDIRSSLALAPRPGSVYLTTSGSTGEPKGVLLQARQVAWTAEQVRLCHGLTPEDRGLTALPFHHINAPVVSLCASLMTGSALVIAPQFSRTQFWSWIDRFEVTWASLVPTIIALLLETEEPAAVPSALRFVRSASAPLPAAHMRRFERRFGVPVIETYGLTEAASQICSNPAPPRQRKPGSVGLPTGIALRIAQPSPAGGDDAPLREVTPGAVGEVCITGPSVIAAYTEGRGATAFRGDWFHTGDLGYVDEEGYLYLTGRLRDVIIRGGENVAPRDVEEALLVHPAVIEAAVIGAPDALYGERVIAFVTLREPWTTALDASLRQFCAERLARYKQPARFVPMRAMPRTAAGKLDRPRLRALWAQHEPATLSELAPEAADGTWAPLVTRRTARKRAAAPSPARKTRRAR